MTKKKPRRLLHFLSVPFNALRDAVRAWQISPHFSQRQYDRRGLLRIKMLQTTATFLASIRIGFSPRVLITRLKTEGLLANLLHVLEVLHRVRPDAQVAIDWATVGDEPGFRYGQPGDDVWSSLFSPFRGAQGTDYVRCHMNVDLAFWGTGKDYLSGPCLTRHRANYHKTYSSWINISNRRILDEVTQIYDHYFRGRFCIGVHIRVDNPKVANCQIDGRAPSPEVFIKTAHFEVPGSADVPWIVFLATDDKGAIHPFRRTFGRQLVVREDIERTGTNQIEVHCREFPAPSLVNAEDVLIDTVLLSRCNVLLHMSSSVSTVASIMNPQLRLVRVRNPHYQKHAPG
jgi:hypothetical protein